MKKNNYTIREATNSLADIGAVALLLSKFFIDRSEHDVPITENTRVRLAKFLTGESRAWLAFYEDQPVGIGGLEDTHLGPAWVEPEHRGNGLQKLLIEPRIQAGGNHTHVAQWSTASQKSLASIGFIKTRELNPGWFEWRLPD